MSKPKQSKIEVIARGVLLDSSGRVLLCVNRMQGYSYLPGGHVEVGETAAAAVEREFLEETGLVVQTIVALAVGEERFEIGDRQYHEINVVFHVEQLGGPSAIAEVTSRENKIAFAWVRVADLAALDFRPPSIRGWLIEWLINPSPMRWLGAPKS